MNPRFRHLMVSSLTLVLFLFLSNSCGNNKKFDFIKADKAFIPYITGFSGGLISASAPIRVKLANQFSEEQQISEGVFDFSPKLKGTVKWVDASTVEFVPEKKLPQGTLYTAEFKLGKLQQMPEKLQKFKFQFAAVHQSAMIKVTPPQCKLQSESMFVEGTIETNDIATDDEIKKAFSATQSGEALAVKWLPTNNKRKFNFRIEGIKRSQSTEKVMLSFEGKAINSESDLREIIEIPAKDKFYVLNAYITNEEDPSVCVFFSQALDPNQELDGLATIYGVGSLGISADGSQLKAYPQNWQNRDGVINLDKSIRSENGQILGENRSIAFNGGSQKPEIRKVTEGYILPNSKGLVVPFQVAHLKAVDVTIMQVFENNVLQLMQDAELSNTYHYYSMNKVAKTILKKRIDLDLKDINSRSRFTNHAIKIDELIKTQPGAIYKVTFDFKKEYSTYPCNEGENEGELSTIETVKSDKQSNTYPGYYYDEEGYDNDYDYTEESYDYSDDYYEDYDSYYLKRQNPCMRQFYSDNHAVSLSVLATDLGLMAQKAGENQWYFVTTNLITSKPAGDIQLELYSEQKQLLATLKTGSDGLAQWNNQTDNEVVYLVVKMGKMRNYMKLRKGGAINISNFDVSGKQLPEGIKGSLFAERGVWRPGDSLFVHFVMDDNRNPLPVSHPIIFELINSRGQTAGKWVQSKTNGVSMYRFACATDDNAPTGNYRAQVKVGNSFFTKTLRVESIIPNRLKINIDIPESGYTYSQAAQKSELKVNWLHGAPAAGLRANIRVNTSALPTSFKAFPNYTFEDALMNFKGEEVILLDADLDDNGKIQFSPIVSTDRKSPGTLQLGYNIRVFEQGGAFSSDRFTTTYKAFPFYAGIQSPKKNVYGGLNAETDYVFQTISVNDLGKPVANRSLTVDVYKVERDWWWQRSEENMGDFFNSSYVKLFQHFDLKSTSSGTSAFKLNVKLDDRGQFLVKVTDKESGHTSTEVVYFGQTAEQSSSDFYDNTSVSNLKLITDKTEYETGDEIKLNIPATEEGNVLISIENGFKVLSRKWIKAKGKDTEFKFKALKEYAPNVYVRAVVIQPHDHSQNDLPIRMFGIVRINVNDKNTHLKPVVNHPESVRPESVVEVSVKEASGKPMEYCLALVDEGLLDLTRFKTPDIWPDFYTSEALGVMTWDIFDNVIGAYGGELESVVTIGGDGEAAGKGKPSKANRFKPMVRVLSPNFLAAGKVNKHRIAIPAYVGSCRIMVIASNINGAYGNAESVMKVQAPLILLATLPRVLTPNETVKLPVNVFANRLSSKQAQLKLSVSGPVRVQGNTTQSVQFAKADDEQLAYFELKVNDKTGIAKATIEAVSGNEKARQTIEIDIRTPNLPVTQFVEKSLAKGQEWAMNLQTIGMEGSNSAVLELSSMPPINLTARLNYLMNYPHGCVEQTTSAAFPQIFVSQLIDLPENKLKEMQSNVRIAIKRLANFQLSDGSFAYWPGLSKADEWSTSYVGHFLLEAQKAGYQVNSSVLDKWKKYQKNKANQWGQNNDKSRQYYNDDANQAYRLFTLALAQMPQSGAMNKLRESTTLTSAAAWRLASTYAMMGQSAAAQSLISKAVSKGYAYDSWSYSYGSAERDDAIVAETYVYLGQYTEALKIIRELSKKLSSDAYMSTQTTAYSLLAVNRYLQAQPGAKGLNFDVSLNGKSSVYKTEKAILTIELGAPSAKGWTGKFINKSGGVVYARVINKGTPGTIEIKESASKINLSVDYVDAKGNSIDMNQIEQGKDFTAVLTVRNTNAGTNARNLALSALFPGAWEINNSRMEANNLENQEEIFDYQDIRDDRVLTYFSLAPGKSQTFRIKLNAAYVGRFYAPSISCEAMYDNSVFARSAGRWIEVVNRKPKVNS